MDKWKCKIYSYGRNGKCNQFDRLMYKVTAIIRVNICIITMLKEEKRINKIFG